MQITKILCGNVTANDGKKEYICSLRGNLKKDGGICVGDYVEYMLDGTDRIIVNKILPRKNILKRPSISNLDNLVILISTVPKADFNLLDALIIYCKQLNIEPIIVISKFDIIDKSYIDEIFMQYGAVCKNILEVSSVNSKNIDKLILLLKNRFSAFAGQSAVGKSTLINKISGLNLATGGLSAKLDRGKHTTRLNEIFYLNDNIKIADTPGFSLFELDNIQPNELAFWYDDFKPFEKNCRFQDCEHINCKAKDCGIVDAVEKGLLSKARYERYADRYKKLKEKWEKRYD